MLTLIRKREKKNMYHLLKKTNMNGILYILQDGGRMTCIITTWSLLLLYLQMSGGSLIINAELALVRIFFITRYLNMISLRKTMRMLVYLTKHNTGCMF